MSKHRYGRRMHKCETCGKLYDCDDCLAAMIEQNEPAVYAEKHRDKEGKYLPFLCPACEPKTIIITDGFSGNGPSMKPE